MPKLQTTLLYKQEDLSSALDEIKRGMPTPATSKKYGVPRTTLLYKHRGHLPLMCRKGPQTNLTPEEEEMLVTWLFHISDQRFPAEHNLPFVII